MGSGSSGSAAYGEPIQLKVPTNKVISLVLTYKLRFLKKYSIHFEACLYFFSFQVGLIIGRGGDTIRNLQSQSGARIQVRSKHSQCSSFVLIMVS